MIWTVWLFVARVLIEHLARLLDLKWNCIVCVGGWRFGSVWNGVDLLVCSMLFWLWV